jgi:hypothetical protein
MVDCPGCGTSFPADAAECMVAMGIVAYAECPACRREFLPFARPDEAEKEAVLQTEPTPDHVAYDWWREDR